MTFKKVIRTDKMAGSEKAFISIRPAGVFSFNSELVKRADLGVKHNRVSIHTDPENWRIKFEFHNNKNDISSFKLYKDGGSKSLAKGMNITARNVFNTNKWLKKVASEDNLLLRRFEPTKESRNEWIIQLGPFFEQEAIESTDIPSVATGIYRYIRNNEIMYIGKGNIRERVNSPKRKDWEFDKIEYSIIEGTEIMSHWESFWLDKFYEKEGRLPLYNKLAGQKKPVKKHNKK